MQVSILSSRMWFVTQSMICFWESCWDLFGRRRNRIVVWIRHTSDRCNGLQRVNRIWWLDGGKLSDGCGFRFRNRPAYKDLGCSSACRAATMTSLGWVRVKFGILNKSVVPNQIPRCLLSKWPERQNMGKILLRRTTFCKSDTPGSTGFWLNAVHITRLSGLARGIRESGTSVYLVYTCERAWICSKSVQRFFEKGQWSLLTFF